MNYLIWFALFYVCIACNTGNYDVTAVWVSPTKDTHRAYGVFMFRNTFDLALVPSDLKLDISADNRYKFFVNGALVAEGPARGDLDHWYYETVNIAPFLQEGKNTLAVQVVNFGKNKQLAQISNRTGLWVRAPEDYPNLYTGNDNWRVKENVAFEDIPFGPILHSKYYVCGPGDMLNMDSFPYEWTATVFDDSGWQPPFKIDGPNAKWQLVPRDIPMMAERNEPVTKVVRSSGLPSIPNKTLKSLTIPPRTKASILLDNGSLTVGYPNLTYSGGKDSEIKLTYAESLFEDQDKKGNRNDIKGKVILGYYDQVRPDGKNFRYEPLWWRTFRYVQLDITTGASPLTIERLTNRFHAYPVTFDYSFKTSDEVYGPFISVAERTLQLCMGETFYDCPYYEQLQYIGDTRVQALINLYTSRDDRLVRKAIRQFYHTLSGNGLTNSRHPASVRQVIPGFTLYWITMLYDYHMLRDDPGFVEQYLPATDSILGYFTDFIDESGMLGNLHWGDTVGGGLPEYWYFTDWSKGFKRGIPEGVYDNRSSVITLHYANTLKQASLLHADFGSEETSARYRDLSEKLTKATMTQCFSKEKGLIAQTPEKDSFAEHPNILAILTENLPFDQQKAMMRKILDDTSLIKSSMYFRFYLFEALKKLGMDDEIPPLLDFWHQSLEKGLTTFPEKEGDTRSDCHGWNASPLYFFLSSFAGIEPIGPGFKKISVSPRFNELKEIVVEVPHPNGMIKVDLAKNEGVVNGTVELPEGSEGVFTWEGSNLSLQSGINQIKLNKLKINESLN